MAKESRKEALNDVAGPNCATCGDEGRIGPVVPTRTLNGVGYRREHECPDCVRCVTCRRHNLPVNDASICAECVKNQQGAR